MSKHKVIGLSSKSGKVVPAKEIDFGDKVIWKPQKQLIIFNYCDLLEQKASNEKISREDRE